MEKKRNIETCCVPNSQASCCKVEAIVNVDERGQMVLPKDLRERAGIRASDKLAVISWERDERVCCISLIKAEDFAERENRENWIRQKNMLVFSFISPNVPYESVDILITSPVSFEEAVKRRALFNVGDIEFSVVSIDDLVKMKKEAGREQDLSDIEMLLKVKEIERSGSVSD